MKEITGNIFDIKDADAICVTTNGGLNKYGELIMGQGTPTANHLAAQFAKEFPWLPLFLGHARKVYGNVPYCPTMERSGHIGPHIVSFPTKWDWKDPSDIHLIDRSAEALVILTDQYNWKKIVLPRPGVGKGKLKWEDVKAVISPILDDRFFVITPENN